MRFFRSCWEGAIVALRAGGVYGPQVPISAGVCQGNAISPMLFNLVVDAILRHMDHLKPELREWVQKIFYADNGRTGGEDPDDVQEVQDVIDDLFEQVGLFVDTSKTVTMTSAQRFRPTQLNPSTVLRAQRCQLRVPGARRWYRTVHYDGTVSTHIQNDTRRTFTRIYGPEGSIAEIDLTNLLPTGMLWMGCLVGLYAPTQTAC
jgi:Reverse transcriptase (RNA-dependent DNA polymerase)